MDRIEVYTFEDRDGNEFGTFTTRDIREAKEYARKYGLRIVARIFEYVDSELVEDYTDADAPAAESRPRRRRKRSNP